MLEIPVPQLDQEKTTIYRKNCRTSENPRGVSWRFFFVVVFALIDWFVGVAT